MTRLILLNAVALGGVVVTLVMSFFPVSIAIPQGASPPGPSGMFLLEMQARPWEVLVDLAVLLALGLDVVALVRQRRRRGSGAASASPMDMAGSDGPVT